MEDAGKLSVWLGVATSLIAVLAFFGIANFEQLREGLGQTSTTSAPSQSANSDRTICEQFQRSIEYQSANSVDGDVVGATKIQQSEEITTLSRQAADPLMITALQVLASDYMQWGLQLQARERAGGTMATNPAATHANALMMAAAQRAQGADRTSMFTLCPS